MDSSMENVENYTKKVSKMCKTPHFPHFDEIYSPSRISHDFGFIPHDFGHGILQKKLSLLSKQASLVIEIGFICH